MTPTEIKKLRKALGLKQHDFGVKIGLSPTCAKTTVSRWEHGVNEPRQIYITQMLSLKEAKQ